MIPPTTTTDQSLKIPIATISGQQAGTKETGREEQKQRDFSEKSAKPFTKKPKGKNTRLKERVTLYSMTGRWRDFAHWRRWKKGVKTTAKAFSVQEDAYAKGLFQLIYSIQVLFLLILPYTLPSRPLALLSALSFFSITFTHRASRAWLKIRQKQKNRLPSE